MGRGESFHMHDLSDKTSQHLEEQVGLLNESKEHYSNDHESSRDGRESSWREIDQVVQHQKPRQSWTRTIFIFSLLACTILVLFHEALSSRHKTLKSPPTSSTAYLRSEEDYILSPDWDFNSPPTTREYTWIISDHTLNPDGVYRPMILINDTFPGPLIECNEGDELVVHIHNRATNATSIHWHGLYQNGTNWMDGTVGITQCAIAPNHSFTYRFKASSQSGTYWYHSHVSMQASDGLVGPLIIHARGTNQEKGALQKMPYEQDRVLLLSDHYYDLSSSLLTQYLAPGSENDEPVPPSALINGRNVRNCSHLPARDCNATGLSNALFDLPRKGNTRLRVINVGAFAEFALQIDEHEVFVTEVDGTDVAPQGIHRLNINPAQRYSVIVTPPPKKKEEGGSDLYWIRARMITHCFAYEEPELQEEVRGVLSYSSPSDHGGDGKTKESVPDSKDWPEIIDVECRDLNTSLLEPVVVVAAPEVDPQHTLYLRSSFQIRDWRLSRGYLNESSFRINGTTPLLHTLLSEDWNSNALDAKSNDDGREDGILTTPLLSPETELTYQTTKLQTITLLIHNFDDGNHPFHLHGYKFFVLAQGHGYPPDSLLQPSSSSSDSQSHINRTNPLRRDTASVEAYGWLLISFVADNPGVWAFHCHIGWHTEAGLMMVFATRVDDMRDWHVPGEVDELCGMEGVERGMGPGDERWIGWKGDE
ncbi:multicopper oxidase [Stemphylium lycopersici]|nr:multicopper oxidase [Stemphylium lycopersici]